MDIRKLRSALCSPFSKYLPPVYRASKQGDQTEDEQRVIDYYENSLGLHIMSFALLIPSVGYYVKYIFKKRELFANTRPTLFRMIFWTTWALNAFVLCVYYDKQYQPNEVEARVVDKYRGWIKRDQL
jgi:hypothetical protein